MTMRKMTVLAASVCLLLCRAAAADNDEGSKAKAKLYLAITGTGADGVTFAGTLSVQKFSVQNGAAVAIGMVTGTVASAGTPLGTVLAGPVAFPVSVEPGSAITGKAPVSVQQATNCQVLHLDIGAVNLNLLGVTVATQPISIDISGTSGGTNVLGTLLCTILDTVNNVIGLVNLLNQLLGILGGLTG